MKYASIYFASNEQIWYPKFNFAQKIKNRSHSFYNFKVEKKFQLNRFFLPIKFLFENIFFRIASDP